jgi:hypothetical protein
MATRLPASGGPLRLVNANIRRMPAGTTTNRGRAK